MKNYYAEEVAIDDLILDERNPRFIIPPNPTQQSIVDYLIDYEEVEQLAIDISKSGGLFAGERVITIKANGKYIVLEGNRRVCACKILMNPQLLQNRRPASVGKIFVTEDTKNSIKQISVDVMESRVKAQSSLAAKHIDGIKKWSTVSKYKFFALEFDAGKSIDEIEIITGVSQPKIKTGLKEFRIIDYVLNLPQWSKYEKEEFLNLQEIKTTRLTRLFSAKTQDPQNLRLKELLGLDYDDKFQIKTELDKNVFDEILHIIAKAAFVPGYCKEFEGTRSTYESIPQLIQFLYESKVFLSGKSDKKVENVNEQNIEEQPPNVYLGSKTENVRNEQLVIQSKNYSSKSNYAQANEVESSKNSINKKQNKQFNSNRNVLIPEDFYVKCKVTKINDIINELKKLNFNYYVNAQAILLRVLIELSLKYYLTSLGEEKRIVENNLEGTFSAVLEIMRLKKMISIAEHSNLTQIRKNDKIFSIFNGYVHYDSVLPSRDNLIFYFDNFRKILDICLNS